MSILSNREIAAIHNTNINNAVNGLDGSLEVNVATTTIGVAGRIQNIVGISNQSVDGIKTVLTNDANNIVQLADTIADFDHRMRVQNEITAHR